MGWFFIKRNLEYHVILEITSTLQYFEKELEQKKKIKLTIPKQNSTLSL